MRWSPWWLPWALMIIVSTLLMTVVGKWWVGGLSSFGVAVGAKIVLARKRGARRKAQVQRELTEELAAAAHDDEALMAAGRVHEVKGAPMSPPVSHHRRIP